MSVFHYLFSFKGRINRAKNWLFILVTILWEIPVLAIFFLGFDWANTLKSLHAASFPTKEIVDWSKIVAPPLATPVAMISIALLVVLIAAYTWASFAVYVKRLHDRNKSAWWLVPYCFLPTALSAFSGYSAVPPWTGEETGVGLAADLIGSLISIWVFIELYCLRGTDGSNHFGVDPLEEGPVFCEIGNPVYGCIPRPQG